MSVAHNACLKLLHVVMVYDCLHQDLKVTAAHRKDHARVIKPQHGTCTLRGVC